MVVINNKQDCYRSIQQKFDPNLENFCDNYTTKKQEIQDKKESLMIGCPSECDLQKLTELVARSTASSLQLLYICTVDRYSQKKPLPERCCMLHENNTGTLPCFCSLCMQTSSSLLLKLSIQSLRGKIQSTARRDQYFLSSTTRRRVHQSNEQRNV